MFQMMCIQPPCRNWLVKSAGHQNQAGMTA